MKLLHRRGTADSSEARAAAEERDRPETAGLPAAEGGTRPLTVSVAAFLAYVLAAACMARGAGDPSATDGTGASGLGLIVLGVFELGLTTLALPGRSLARACLLGVLVLGGVIVVVDQGQPAWFRGIAIGLGLAIVVLFSLVRPSRVYFGDDDTSLVP